MTYLLRWPDDQNTRPLSVVQGEFQVSDSPDVTFTTVLGSCVAVCLFDATARVGGMNHYLLAKAAGDDEQSLKYGAHAMELLINALLKQGARRDQLRAKVFGGGVMNDSFRHIGPQNSAFALRYLSTEGIPVEGEDIGGRSARRVNFHPTTGRARSAIAEPTLEVAQVQSATAPKARAQSNGGDIELF